MHKIKLLKSTIGNGSTVKFDIDGGAFIFKTGLFEHERVSVSQIMIVGKIEHRNPQEPTWVSVVKGIGGIALVIFMAIGRFVARAGVVVGGVIGSILIWKGSVWQGIGMLLLGGISPFFATTVSLFVVAIVGGFCSALLEVFSGELETKFICGFKDGRVFYGRTDASTYTIIRLLSPQSSGSSEDYESAEMAS